MIQIRPTAGQRRDFARWAVAQTPKVRTVTTHDFAVPSPLFADMPEELLVGALVEGRRYVSPEEDARTGTPPPGDLLGVSNPNPGAQLLECGLCYEEDGEEVHPHPECPLGTAPALVEAAMTAALTAVELAALNTAQGPMREAVRGDVLPEVPAASYAPDSVALEPATGEGGDSSGLAADGPPYACGLCPRDFPTKRGRDMHRSQKHPEAPDAG
ncbi:hypothetical protein [Streptomyces sp. NPDC007346]|uniref:hypothetical protein n=1 Tax=Streptomyces sp. NPDC007346 TaxID=3154682 RepID=UPI003455F184